MPIEKRATPFTADEYRARVARCQSAMQGAGAQAFVVTDSSNICYLSGYGAASSYVVQALVVFGDEEDPVIVLRRQDAPAGKHMCYMPNERVIGYSESFVGSHQVDGFDFLFDMLKARPGIDHVGLELGSVSGSTLDKLRARYTGVKLVDMSGVVVKHRLIKSPREVEVIRAASKITDAGMQRALEVMVPGVRECDAAAEITAALIRGTPEFGGDRGQFPVLPGGPQSGTSHLNWSDEPITVGRHYNLEFGGFRHRYAAGLMRTISMGKPPQRLRRLMDHMVEGCNAALSVAKPGATTGQVATAYGDVVARGGYDKDSRCGYPIGIDWLETSCSLRSDDPTVLQVSMVFHLMLGMWIEDDFGAVVSETFVVTPQGCEALSQIERDLLVV